VTSDRRRLDIGFVHPGRGIGGAERLVLDAARHLRHGGHRVTLFVSDHDIGRCFGEPRDPGLDIRIHGNFLPSHVGQRLRAPCAIARMAYLTVALARSRRRFDVIFCDVVAHTLQLLKRVTRARILFYCHFPDRQLAPRTSWLSRVYRAPIDRLEMAGTGSADRVLVNSRFTERIFRQTFPRLSAVPLEVLHPGVDCGLYGMRHGTNARAEDTREVLLLSVNRYERAKNHGLAVEAVALLRERLPPDVFGSVRLVIAGAYDDRRREHRETFRGLEALVRRRGLEDRVGLMRSCSEDERLALLARCRCVVYAPAAEHFGMGAVEAMAAGRPVVAVAGGGTLETVQHERTGLLCAPTPPAFADALARLISSPEMAERMGQAGRLHVAAHFSLETFGARLDAIVRDLAAAGDRS
jgi:alpha-1,3/alpha-1,6-mannosyltransferase